MDTRVCTSATRCLSADPSHPTQAPSPVTPVTSRPPEPKAKPHVAPEPKASPRVSPRLHRKETLAAVWVDLMLTLQTR